MKKLLVITIVATLAIVAGAIFLSSSKGKTSKASSAPEVKSGSHLYFYSYACPHCARVEEFLSTWENKDKIEFTKLEVTSNQGNALLLNQKAIDCGVPSNQIGVPFLVTPENQCFAGDLPIIDFLSQMEFTPDNP